MPFFPTGKSRIYRALRFGDNVDLVMLDQRQYRDDQPCGDATVPPCADLDAPRAFLGRSQMDWAKQRLASSGAAWKVVGNELMMMNAEVTGGAYYGFDSWQGYVDRARGAARAHQDGRDQGRRLRHRRHPHVHRRRRAHAEEPRRVGRARVRRRLDHLAVLRRDRPADRRRPGAQGQRRQPEHAAGDHRHAARPEPVGRPGRLRPPRLRRGRGDEGQVRRHPAAREDDQEALTRALPTTGFHYSVARGQTSIKGVNGPPA